MSKKNPKYLYRYCLICNCKRISFKLKGKKWLCNWCRKTKNIPLRDAYSIISERKRRQEESLKASQPLPASKPKKELAGSNFLKKEMPNYKDWLERKNKKSMFFIPSIPPLILPRGKK